jgi:hypothetical protein
MSRTYEALKQQHDEQERRKTRQELTTTTALPALPVSDGFDDAANSSNSFAPIISFDGTRNENQWHDRNGNPVGGRWLVTGLEEEIVYWDKNTNLPDRTKSIPKEPGKPLPNVEDMNDRLDRSLWRTTPYGLQGPYQHQRIVHLLDPATAAERRFISTSGGGAVCYYELGKSVQKMRRLQRQPHLNPIVELSTAKSLFKRGPELRPYLHPVEWMVFGNSATPAPAIEHQPDNGNGGPEEPPPYDTIPEYANQD